MRQLVVPQLRGPVQWRFVAKDGADLPASQVRDEPGQLRIDVGETYDFLWTPEAGDYELRVVTTFDQGVGAFPLQAPGPHTAVGRIVLR